MGSHRVDVEISLLFDADFADLFEVKDDLTKTGAALPAARAQRRDARLRPRRLPPGDLHPRPRTPFFTEQSLTFRVSLRAARDVVGDGRT